MSRTFRLMGVVVCEMTADTQMFINSLFTFTVFLFHYKTRGTEEKNRGGQFNVKC